MEDNMQLSEQFESALVFAARLHASQRRKGTDIPYVSHLLAVASLVLEHGGTEDEAIAALLHDAVEDQGGQETLDRIRERFGDGVADIVDACTDAYGEPKPPWRARKEAYLASIPLKSMAARRVSLADKIHNARAILSDYRVVGESLWPRFNAGKRGTLWYYRSLAEAFGQSGPEPLASELMRVVVEIERLSGGFDGASA
jgi:GTP pyrophosphokinase